MEPDYVGTYDNRRLAFLRKREDNSNFGFDYNKAIQQNPDDPKTYYDRGEFLLRLKRWEKALEDLTTAKNMGADIIALFRNSYLNVAHFEEIYQVKLPEDITAMLTPPQ